MSTHQVINPTAIFPETWKPILWREWQKSRQGIHRSIFFFVAVFMIVPIDFDGVLLLVGTLIAGQHLAVVLGGSDISEGSERYAFTLPLRRADYFWARYLAGLILLSSLVGVSYLLNAYDLHRYFWGLFCESGLTGGRALAYPTFPLGYSILCGIFAYSNSYCVVVHARRPGTLSWGWFLGILLTYALPFFILVFASRFYQWSEDAGYYGRWGMVTLLSAMISALLLIVLSRAYAGKGSDSPFSNSDDR